MGRRRRRRRMGRRRGRRVDQKSEGRKGCDCGGGGEDMDEMSGVSWS